MRQLEAMGELLDFERRAVGHEQELCALTRQKDRAVSEPNVFANRQTYSRAAEFDRRGQWTGCEDSLLVEDAVVRQLVLEPQMDASVRDESDGVVKSAVTGPRQRHHQSGPPVGALVLQFAESGRGSLNEGGFQHQILGRVSDNNQLREDHEIRPHGAGLGARVADLRHISADVPDSRIQLRDGDGQHHRAEPAVPKG